MNPDVLLSLLHDKQQEVLKLREMNARKDAEIAALRKELEARTPVDA